MLFMDYEQAVGSGCCFMSHPAYLRALVHEHSYWKMTKAHVCTKASGHRILASVEVGLGCNGAQQVMVCGVCPWTISLLCVKMLPNKHLDPVGDGGIMQHNSCNMHLDDDGTRCWWAPVVLPMGVDTYRLSSTTAVSAPAQQSRGLKCQMLRTNRTIIARQTAVD
jgi:hypothetical protein